MSTSNSSSSSPRSGTCAAATTAAANGKRKAIGLPAATTKPKAQKVGASAESRALTLAVYTAANDRAKQLQKRLAFVEAELVRTKADLKHSDAELKLTITELKRVNAELKSTEADGKRANVALAREKELHRQTKAALTCCKAEIAHLHTQSKSLEKTRTQHRGKKQPKAQTKRRMLAVQIATHNATAHETSVLRQDEQRSDEQPPTSEHASDDLQSMDLSEFYNVSPLPSSTNSFDKMMAKIDAKDKDMPAAPTAYTSYIQAQAMLIPHATDIEPEPLVDDDAPPYGVDSSSAR